jgi:hypothetical protein
MKLGEREEMNRLCRLIQDERDPAKFEKLVQKLIELLHTRELQLESPTQKP